MFQRFYVIRSLLILIIFSTENLSAQSIFFPREPMLSRIEKIAENAKKNGLFVTYESRFLEALNAPELVCPSSDIEECLRLSLIDTPLTYKKINSSRFVIVRNSDKATSSGYLAGKITDVYGTPLPGATILVQNLQKGTMTGMNGDYSLSLPSGAHTVEVRLVGYESIQIENTTILANKTTPLHVALNESAINLNEIIVTETIPENIIVGALHAQRNTPNITSIVSSQQINRSASTNVRETLKYFSGASADENDALIIRGADGRWNTILLDGILQPNYTPSYKIFSFDLIPIDAVDNIRLMKSSTPDIPFGFVGGILDITTKDIPEQNYMQLKASYQLNTISTFKNQRGRAHGTFDFSGFDDGSRNMPESIHSVMPGKKEVMPENEVLFSTDRFRIYDYKTPPSQHYSLTVGRTRTLKNGNNRLGLVLSLSYRNTQQQTIITHTQRGRWDYVDQFTGDLGSERNAGNIYRYNAVTGGILNVGWQFGKNRISIRNIYTRSFDNDLTEITQNLAEMPEGQNNLSRQFFNYPTFSDLFQHKLEGQHALKNTSVQWHVSHTFVRRESKEAAFSEMYKPLKDDSLLFYLHHNAELKSMYPASSGWYDNQERGVQIGVSASFPFKLKEINGKASVGYQGNNKSIQYIYNEALYQYEDKADIDNSSSRVYQVIEGNRYKGHMIQHFPFVMFEHRVKGKLRIVWGFRGDNEYFRTAPPYKQYMTHANGKWYFIPSANLSYKPSEDLHLRLSYQHSVIRPQLADYIPFPTYDTSLLGTSINRPVHPSSIKAVDFFAEKYFSPFDFISAGLFYRHIDRPIERTTYRYGMDEYMYILQNSDNAFSYGLDMEVRKQLDFISESDILSKTTFTAGAIFTQSLVEGKRLTMVPQETGEERFIETQVTQKRPLSGQTTYLLNAGVSYTNELLNVNLLLYLTGRQLFLLGENAYQHEYRAPFNNLEASVNYRLPKRGILFKLSGSNLLNAAQTFYTNTSDDYVRDEYHFPTDKLLRGKTENYDKEKDPITHLLKNGQTFRLSISKTF